MYMYVLFPLYMTPASLPVIRKVGVAFPMLTFISTTVMATQTIGIPSALCFYTTNELSVGPVLLALGCVTAYRAVVILLVFL